MKIRTEPYWQEMTEREKRLRGLKMLPDCKAILTGYGQCRHSPGHAGPHEVVKDGVLNRFELGCRPMISPDIEHLRVGDVLQKTGTTEDWVVAMIEEDGTVVMTRSVRLERPGMFTLFPSRSGLVMKQRIGGLDD